MLYSKILKHSSILLILLLLLTGKSPGQQFSQEFSDNPGFSDKKEAAETYFVFQGERLDDIKKDIQSLNASMFKAHMLGTPVAKRLHLLEESYTHYYKAPGAISSRKVVQKPAIYNSIYEMEKYFRKKVRKALQDKEMASEKMSHFLEIALILLYKDTEEFEQSLKNCESEQALIGTFGKVTFK
jgi:hypothetical protein